MIVRITRTLLEKTSEFTNAPCYTTAPSSCLRNFMEPRFKSNNFIAILIALLLIAAGFTLAFIHRHSKSQENNDKKPVAAAIADTAKNERARA